jgi:GAF domain-containing protein
MPSRDSQPLNEQERLAALAAWQILDTDAEQAFDELTQLASRSCGTPIALVSLVAESRQWFKSRVGLDATETPRDMAFCAHTILNDQPMIVEDTWLDDRFRDSPLVTGPPNIRFYAGAPLVDDEGHALGSLCVIDRQPRKLTAEQTNTLQLLSHQVMRLMELRRANHRLAETLKRVACLAQLVPICSYCHAIREQPDDWQRLEEFFGVQTGIKFSHGICPPCMAKHYPDFIAGMPPTS